MGNLKKVYDPETKEIVIISAKSEPDWQSKYYHASGVPFENPVIEEVKEQIVEVEEDSSIRVKYEEKFGKKVPNNKKNDIEWIESKLSE